MAPSADYSRFSAVQLPEGVPRLTWERTATHLATWHATSEIARFLKEELLDYMKEENLLSVLDGWWAEAYDGTNGWAFPGEVHPDPAAQDARDAATMYDLFEQEIAPAFYDRDSNGLPRSWGAVKFPWPGGHPGRVRNWRMRALRAERVSVVLRTPRLLWCL